MKRTSSFSSSSNPEPEIFWMREGLMLRYNGGLIHYLTPWQTFLYKARLVDLLWIVDDTKILSRKKAVRAGRTSRDIGFRIRRRAWKLKQKMRKAR